MRWPVVAIPALVAFAVVVALRSRADLNRLYPLDFPEIGGLAHD